MASHSTEGRSVPQVFAEESERSKLPPGPKVNLGCGPIQPTAWVNVDGSNRAWLASRLPFLDRLLTRCGALQPTEFGPHITLHNLFKPLPFALGTVSCIYAGEVWEHFTYPDAARLTRECWRVLAPGGVLRVCVPDGITFWKHYIDLYEGIKEKPKCERSAEPLREQVAMYFREICTEKRLLRSMGHTHKWQFDEIQLVELFESSGFSQVERMRYHESRIPDVASVEVSPFLIVEGVKPSKVNSMA